MDFDLVSLMLEHILRQIYCQLNRNKWYFLFLVALFFKIILMMFELVCITWSVMCACKRAMSAIKMKWAHKKYVDMQT